jgi:hypothetical protein
MRIRVLILLMCMSVTNAVQAQKPAPVEDLSSREGALLQGQQRASLAYRELEQAQHDAKFAEQDYLNLQDAYLAAQKRADAIRRETESAKKTLDVAKAKEIAARQRYEKAVNAVGQPLPKPPAK